ncbi:hypothetical protein F5J12DRAFT_721142, partial [Pisolithus orientalis]|uniref:uncharacterized protein n=1 Tax=Pisolithus orientalis TaxID=936130 RepID=UPI00222422CB
PQLLVPRPCGQLSKPGAGGYCLREVLKSDQSLYCTVQVNVQKICQESCNLSKPYHEQPKDIHMLIKTMVQHNFPSLKQYQDAWPAADFATIFLKNTSLVRQ